MSPNAPATRRRVSHAITTAIVLSACSVAAANPPAIGGPAPDFTLTDTFGQPVSLKAYRGSVVYLSVGPTW